jgi:primosomal replication protein N
MSNNVTLIGNLVEDPELRFTPSGVPMAKIRLAVSRRWRDNNGDWQEESSFFGGTVWREQAEAVAESLQKGNRVIVTGRLLGDPGGREALHRRDRHRRDRTQPSLGNRPGHPHRPRWWRR